MTKHLSLLIIILLVIINAKLQAQDIRLRAPSGYNYIYNEPYFTKGMEGSPYLDDWQSADILLKNGKTISGLMVRYNVYTKEMLYKDNGKTYIIGTPDSISEIKFSDKIFIYKEYKNNKKGEKCYFEVFVNGKASLLNKYEIEVIFATYNTTFAVGNKNDRLFLKQQLYLQKGDHLMALNKNKLLEFLYDKKDKVSYYIDKNKLSVKNKEDIIKILVYYNQLQ